MASAILRIDTSSQHEIVVSVTVDGKTTTKKNVAVFRSSQLALPMIDDLLHEVNLSPSQLTNIEVSVGPGSFTGIRVGVAIAHTFGFIYDIPVNGARALVKPMY